VNYLGCLFITIWCTVGVCFCIVDDAHFSVIYPLILCVIVCRDRTKAALVKNIKITNNQLTDEQIEEKIDNNDISVFSSAIIQVLMVGVSAYRAKSRALLCSGCEMRIRMAHPDPGGLNDPQRKKKRKKWILLMASSVVFCLFVIFCMYIYIRL
jgi:hypothetical protein